MKDHCKKLAATSRMVFYILLGRYIILEFDRFSILKFHVAELIVINETID
jgi:hypothetical protein